MSALAELRAEEREEQAREAERHRLANLIAGKQRELDTFEERYARRMDDVPGNQERQARQSELADLRERLAEVAP